MKILRTFLLVALIISCFVTVDLGLNFANSLVPALNDGISSNSILQRIFGVLGDSGWSQAKFFSMFETSMWITFVVFVLNSIATALSFFEKKRKNRYF